MVDRTPSRAFGSGRRRGTSARAAGLCAVVLLWPIAAGAQGSAAGSGGTATGGTGAAGATRAGTAGGPATGPGAAGAAGPGMAGAAAGQAGSGQSGAASGVRASALRLGGLGFPVVAEPEAAPGAARAWTLRPSLSVEVMATDNVLLTPTDRRADLITTVSPSLVAAAETTRVTASISYRPVAAYYAWTDHQNRLDHYLNGQALVALLPDLFFVDVRASSDVTSLRGGVGGPGTPLVDRRDRLQTTSVQVSPYLQFRVPSLGTAQIGYSFQYVDQSAGGNGLGGGNANPVIGGLGGTPFFTSGDYISHEGFAVLRTGEEFGRLSLAGRLSAVEYDGEGVLDGASRRIGVVESRYALTNVMAALLDLGYEQQRYGGVRPYRLDSPIWAVGVQLTGADSALTAKYGRRDGFEAFYLDGSIALGGRTRLLARYDERLTTAAQRAAQQLADARLDQAGNPVDPVTGIPLSPLRTDNLLATQLGLLRVRTATAAISQTWPRDTVTLSLTRQEIRPVNADPRTTPLIQDGLTGAVSWVRALTPELTGSLFGQYGTTETAGRGSSDSYAAGVALNRDFGQGLSGTVQYRHTSRGASLGLGRAAQNVVLVGLRKDFW